MNVPPAALLTYEQLRARVINSQPYPEGLAAIVYHGMARRGALEVPLPIGLVYNAAGAVVLDPDPRIQAGVRLIFDTFRQMRTTRAVQDRFRCEGLKFPYRIRGGAGKGRVIFGPVDVGRIAQILHNPRYAGAFVYGRSRVVKTPNFKRVLTSAREHWQVLIKNAHPGYIS